MSVDIIIANFRKREYFDGLLFNELISDKNFIQGFSSIALSMLSCDTSRSISLNLLGGSWCGDHIAAISDCGIPDAEGFITTTKEQPNRNLYAMVSQEYRDISPEVVAMVCDRLDNVADELARRAQKEFASGKVHNTIQIWNLGNVVSATGCFALDWALRCHVGENWLQIYEEANIYYRSLGW